MRLVFLDSGVLSLLSSPSGRPRALATQRWGRDLLAAGVRILVPEIADYEVWRKLVHSRATAGLARLDRLKIGFDYVPITTDAMILAADLWASARHRGRPTAPPDALDGDCILAAQALLTARPADLLTVATDNVGHLGLFVDAKPWEQIAP